MVAVSSDLLWVKSSFDSFAQLTVHLLATNPTGSSLDERCLLDIRLRYVATEDGSGVRTPQSWKTAELGLNKLHLGSLDIPSDRFHYNILQHITTKINKVCCHSRLLG